MSAQDEDPRGPVESGPWPERLPAQVVSPQPPHRVHGFDLCEDLGPNYDFGEYVLTALTGAPPERAWGRAVNLSLTALGAITVADAPVHAATISRRCGAHARTALATGLIGLCEHAAHLLDTPPEETRDPASARRAAALRARMPPQVRTQLDDTASTVESVALEVLRRAGLRTPSQLTAALCLAKLPALAAELEATEPGDLRGYPMGTPPFEYVEDESDG